VRIPYTADARPDTGVTNSQLGIWLFLASELMLFGSLFSAYALLRTGATTWPDQAAVLNVRLGVVNTAILLVSSLTAAHAASAARHVTSGFGRKSLVVTILLGLVFLAVKAVEYSEELGAGFGPATNNFLGLYYVLTGLHALHLAGGILVFAYLSGPGGRMQEQEPQRFAQRIRIAALYWHFVDGIWVSMFVVLYLL
jgi:cytochrome c oxidase subunit III